MCFIRRFEIYAMSVCSYRGPNRGAGDEGTLPPHVCQLWPGLFVHEEVDDKH